MTTTNIKHSWRNWSSWKPMEAPEKQSTLLHLVELEQQVGNGERSNVVIQTETHVGSITPTRTTKSAKSPSKQPLYKSLIRQPKIIKDRLKNLHPIRLELFKQKSQVPISETTKIQMNAKVNKERPGSTFKMPSRKKSPISTKQSGINKTPTKEL